MVEAPSIGLSTMCLNLSFLGPSRLWVLNTPTAFLQKSKTPNKCLGYDTKQSHGEATVILELWGMQSTPSFPSLSGPFWPGVVAPDRVLSMGKKELNCELLLNIIV